MSQKQIVDKIDIYDIKRDAWMELAEPVLNKSMWVAAYMSVAHQISESEIIVFGGKNGITGQIFNGVFVLDLEKMVIRERGSLVNPCSFMSTPLIFNRSLFAFGNDVYVHKYNIPEQRWSVIAKTIS